MFVKIISILVILALAVVPVAMGQAAETEASADDNGQTVEMLIIHTASISTNREQNLFALENIENEIGRGNTGSGIYAALERLVFAGTQNRVVSRGGNVVNNFPEVRQEAARQLGELGTEEARAILLRAGLSERDPVVLQEILTSIGNVDSEDNAQTVSAIVWVANRFHRSTSPNNHVALAAINALDNISGRDGGITNPGAIEYLFKVADGPYSFFIRERAWEIIDSLRGSAEEG